MGAQDEVPPDLAAEKTRLRARFQQVRSERSPVELEAARASIRAVLLERLAGVDCVAAYVPLRTEPGSLELLAALDAGGARVLVPATRADSDLDWQQWRLDGLGEPLGLTAIEAARFVLVPALAVAADGTRLGRGGGSYDRALPRCAPGTALVALIFEGEFVPELPRDPWDQAVTSVVLPSRWVDVDRNTEGTGYR